MVIGNASKHEWSPEVPKEVVAERGKRVGCSSALLRYLTQHYANERRQHGRDEEENKPDEAIGSGGSGGHGDWEATQHRQCT